MTTALMFAAAAGLIALSAAIRWRQIQPLLIDSSTGTARVDLPVPDKRTLEDFQAMWLVEDIEDWLASRETAK